MPKPNLYDIAVAWGLAFPAERRHWFDKHLVEALPAVIPLWELYEAAKRYDEIGGYQPLKDALEACKKNPFLQR